MDITIQNYRVRIKPAAMNGFWAEMPALPGCFSQGESVEEVSELINKAIEFHCSLLQERGLKIPLDKEHDTQSQISLLYRRRGMDADRFVSILQESGFVDVKRYGNHAVLVNEESGRQVTVPVEVCDLSPSLIKRVLKDAGISGQFYRELRLRAPLE
jgi:predicted RNase H-like HicB family nuclease/predicted RNA binding protein YcfA (HicA-like mRNA interferase family)